MKILHNDYFQFIENNRRWAEAKIKTNPHYFEELSLQQNPEMLVIGCSDSRVPLTSLTESEPGDIFVHRNIANQVNSGDMNLLSVLEYAVEVLNIHHIVVLGHYKCGGIKSAVEGTDKEIVENWISSIDDLYHKHKHELVKLPTYQQQLDKLAELNVIAQLKNILKTPIIHRAMKRKVYPMIHGWIFDIYTGLLKDLELPLEIWHDHELLDNNYYELLKKLREHC